MNTTLATVTTASLSLSTSSITLPASVPSGYARQAKLEATLANGFRSYDAQVAR